jgi:hypothetical protein
MMPAGCRVTGDPEAILRQGFAKTPTRIVSVTRVDVSYVLLENTLTNSQFIANLAGDVLETETTLNPLSEGSLLAP